MKRSNIFRSAGWLAVAVMLGAALVAPAAALAHNNQTCDVSFSHLAVAPNCPRPTGSAEDETGTPEGSVVEETGTPEGSVVEETGTPEGSVVAETGTPNVTPPPTDLAGSTSTPSNDSWRLVLVAMAALLASVLVLTPAPRRSRR